MLVPSFLNRDAHMYIPGEKKTPPRIPISVGQKYNFHKWLLRDLEQEIRGFWVMRITGKGIIIFKTKMVCLMKSDGPLSPCHLAFCNHTMNRWQDHYSYVQHHQESARTNAMYFCPWLNLQRPGTSGFLLLSPLFPSLSSLSLSLSYPNPFLLSFLITLLVPLVSGLPHQLLLLAYILRVFLLQVNFLTIHCS